MNSDTAKVQLWLGVHLGHEHVQNKSGLPRRLT